MKKKLPLLLVVLLCVATLLSACSTNVAANRGRNINSINHRGYVDAPENTLSAFRLSREMGFSMVECDVSFTKDGVPVLLHDSTINRTSNGKGNIRDLTLDEVKQYDFGSWKDAQYAGEQIPTFDEFLQLCKQLDIHPYVEIKSGATESEVDTLAELAKIYTIEMTWISFDFEILAQLAKIFPNGRFGYLVHFVTFLALERILLISTDTNYVFADCFYVTLTNTQIELCEQNAIPVEIWTLNNERKIADVHPYISGITSDTCNAQSIFAKL